MRKQNGTATYKDLAVLAGSCGLVENSEAGRQAFVAWMSNDQKAARKALFSRVAARRAAASAAKAQHDTQYPGGWLRAAGAGGAPAAKATATKKYPGNWLRGSALPGPRSTGPRITEGQD